MYKEQHCCDECANPDCTMVGQEMTTECKTFISLFQARCHHVFLLPTGGEIVSGKCIHCGIKKYHANVMRDRAIMRVEFLNKKMGVRTLRWRKRSPHEERLLESTNSRGWGGGIIMLGGEDE